jgi:hypothetical protein
VSFFRSVQRINQSKRDSAQDAFIETLDLTKWVAAGAKVHRVFLDPLGAHLVLSLKPTDPDQQPDLLYLNREAERVKITTLQFCANFDLI